MNLYLNSEINSSLSLQLQDRQLKKKEKKKGNSPSLIGIRAAESLGL